MSNLIRGWWWGGKVTVVAADQRTSLTFLRLWLRSYELVQRYDVRPTPSHFSSSAGAACQDVGLLVGQIAHPFEIFHHSFSITDSSPSASSLILTEHNLNIVKYTVVDEQTWSKEGTVITFGMGVGLMGGVGVGRQDHMRLV